MSFEFPSTLPGFCVEGRVTQLFKLKTQNYAERGCYSLSP